MFSRSPIAGRPAALGRATRRFARNRSGATAVEFAIVAMPLLFMLFSLMELALVFMVSSTLENATAKVARTVRTGAVQMSGGGSKSAFRDAICAELGWLESQCQANLSVDVRTYTQFANQNAPDPIQVAGGVKSFNEGATTYQTGNPGDIILVRAFYRWKLVSPFLKGGLERLSGGVTMLTAAFTFRNEPYGSP